MCKYHFYKESLSQFLFFTHNISMKHVKICFISAFTVCVGVGVRACVRVRARVCVPFLRDSMNKLLKGTHKWNYKEKSPKKQFLVFMINNSRLSSFIFLYHFPYSGHKFAITWSFKAPCIRSWMVLITLKIDLSPFLLFCIFQFSKCSSWCSYC